MQTMPKPYVPKEWENIEAVRSSQGQPAEDWVLTNKRVAGWYRDSLRIVKIIYDHAYHFLLGTLNEKEEDICLPIDIRKLAEKCDFTTSSEDLFDLEKSDRFSPVAQLQMRKKLSGNGEITGTIRVADYLSETSARFSIAHELGHYVLREHSPIGLNYMLEACPGLYPLADTDELLADLFAYGLLLPYPVFLQLKEQYEQDDSRWPIDFSDWISFLQEQTQMPEYHVVLAYQGIKQYSLAEKLERARDNKVTPLYLKKLVKKLLGKNLAKDQIVEALKSNYQGPQDCVQEIVEAVQDMVSNEEPFEEAGSNGETAVEPAFPAEWMKAIIQNLYQQGIPIDLIVSATDQEQDVIDRYIEEIDNRNN